jgi:hypothetical protein
MTEEYRDGVGGAGIPEVQMSGSRCWRISSPGRPCVEQRAITALTVLLELTAMDDGEVFDQPLLTREFARPVVGRDGLLSGRSTIRGARDPRVVLDVAVGIRTPE